MTEQLRQQLKILLNSFAEQRNDIEMYVDKIIELFQENDQIHPATNEQLPRRSRNIFDTIPTFPPANAAQRPRSSTYNEQGLVSNFNTMLYNNRDIDWQFYMKILFLFLFFVVYKLELYVTWS